MRVSVDRERCCSSGLCAAAIPEVFDQDEEDGRVLLITPEPPPELAADVEEAAAVCPGRAITVR